MQTVLAVVISSKTNMCADQWNPADTLRCSHEALAAQNRELDNSLVKNLCSLCSEGVRQARRSFVDCLLLANLAPAEANQGEPHAARESLQRAS